VHLAWRRQKEELRNLPFPMLADVKRELAGALGILDPEAGVAQRATFIVDPHGVIRFVYVTDLNVGRSPRKCCACWTPCRPMSCAPATGRRRRHAEGGLR